jgi:hypothetical protein
LRALLDKLLYGMTVNDGGHVYLLPLISTRRWRTLRRRAESEMINGLDHLRDRHGGWVERHDRFLCFEAHIRPTHALQPFQGLLDRDRSGASGHPVHGEDDR